MTSFVKTAFSALASKAKYGFDQQGLIWYVFRLRSQLVYIANVLNVSLPRSRLRDCGEINVKMPLTSHNPCL